MPHIAGGDETLHSLAIVIQGVTLTYLPGFLVVSIVKVAVRHPSLMVGTLFTGAIKKLGGDTKS